MFGMNGESIVDGLEVRSVSPRVEDYVKSLREYASPAMATPLRNRQGADPAFVTSPSARYALKALHFNQKAQAERLAMPR